MRPDQLEQARAEVELWKPGTLDEAANSVIIPASWNTKVSSSTGADKRNMIRDAQSLLAKLGFDPGPADGVMGAKTRNAIMAFQQRSGMTIDGKLTGKIIDKMKSTDI